MADQKFLGAPTERTMLRRLAKRAVYDREVIDSILDEALVCHVAFVHEGAPCVVPTAYTRYGDWVYLHGAQKNRMLRSICGQQVCVNVTLVDGLVLARSTFHHSINYRSVVIYGVGEEVTDREEKFRSMEWLVEHIVPGRWDDARQPNEQELAQTLIVRVPTTECSAKVRTGNPVEEEEDLTLPVWAGVLQMKTSWEELTPDSSYAPLVGPPEYLTNYRRGRR